MAFSLVTKTSLYGTISFVGWPILHGVEGVRRLVRTPLESTESWGSLSTRSLTLRRSH